MQIIENQEKEITNTLRKKYTNLLDDNDFFKKYQSNVSDWIFKTKLYLDTTNPFLDYRDKINYWEEMYKDKSSLLNKDIIENYKKFCQFVKIPFDDKFWINHLEASDAIGKNRNGKNKKAQNKRIPFRLLLDNWNKEIDKAESEWHISTLNDLRKKFLSELEQWLSLIDELKSKLSNLGLDFGIWFDDSLGKLNKKNIETLKRWLNHIANDENIKEIADLLGKMNQIEKSNKLAEVQETLVIQTPVVDINSKEEIIGIKLGKDLEYTLPSELALMSDPTTSILFDLKYLESKLMCFELHGITNQEIESIANTEREVQEDEELGPMILCVDTSGSMNGPPEYIAKAVALFLGNKAKQQKRKCFIINFSTSINTFEITESQGVDELINFLNLSFNGGTDVAPALIHTLQLLESEDYKKADVLVISDFVMGQLSNEMLDNIAKQREFGTKFNSLVIGNLFMNNRLHTYFDNEWIYNPNSHTIQELVKFNNNLSQ